MRISIPFTVRLMRVVVTDPPAFTPWYDHELACALARAGADVTVSTSRFRFGALPAPEGYRRTERFYPLSSRLFRRSPLRIPLKVAEHAFVAASLAATHPDVLHVQWLALPQVDMHLRYRAPTVFTAHDLLPRRTAGKRKLWQTALQRFDRVVVHTERGREVMGELGVEARVIPHPVYPSSAIRADDGATVLALGVIRPYKGIADSVEVVRRLPGARLLVAGDPAMPIDELRAAPRTEWRLGYLSAAELDRALSDTTVALFPYRPEIDQSGALLQALGAGVPAVVYDVAGLADPIRAFGAGRVVPAGDVDALTAAVGELLGDPVALAGARAGAERARAALTWDAAAAAHLALYEELL